MKSWKDYNVLRESTPVEDRDRIAKEMAPLEAMHDPELARKNLRARSYDRKEYSYQRAVHEVARTIRACMESLGISKEVIGSTLEISALYTRFDLEDVFTSQTNPDVSLYFGEVNGGDLNDVSSLKDFTRKVAQGKELRLGALSLLNINTLTASLTAEFNKIFKNVLDEGFSEKLSRAQTNFFLKMIDAHQAGTSNPCRALKSVISRGLIDLSCNIDPTYHTFYLIYDFSLSSKMDEKDKDLIIRAMKDIVDFTRTFNHPGEDFEEEA